MPLLGAIAQLGERLHGMQEVSGSIPLSSTIFQTIFCIFLNGLEGILIPLVDSITVLQEAAGHHRVTWIG